MNPLRPALRLAMTAFQSARRAVWYVRRPDVRGVQAIPLTPSGKVILVKHRYARGWHIPGGGQKKNEDPRAAVLRELREEIGLQAHGEVHPLGSFVYHPDHRRSTVTAFLVKDVSYRPRWSLEIEEVREFDLSNLPGDTTAVARERLAELHGGETRMTRPRHSRESGNPANFPEPEQEKLDSRFPGNDE